VTLLKHIDKPSLILTYEQLHIPLVHQNNQLIPEQRHNEQTHIFNVIFNQYLTSHSTWNLNKYLHLNPAQPVSFQPAYRTVSSTGMAADISTNTFAFSENLIFVNLFYIVTYILHF